MLNLVRSLNVHVSQGHFNKHDTVYALQCICHSCYGWKRAFKVSHAVLHFEKKNKKNPGALASIKARISESCLKMGSFGVSKCQLPYWLSVCWVYTGHFQCRMMKSHKPPVKTLPIYFVHGFPGNPFFATGKVSARERQSATAESWFITGLWRTDINWHAL